MRMGWTLRTEADGTQVWRCSRYADLNYAEINNFAEYGSPVSPYEKGFNQDYVPDFKKIIIEMPQSEVMNNGFGKMAGLHMFAIAQRFLNDSLPIKFGSYSFDDLVKAGLARRQDRFNATNLYTTSAQGDISAGDAAYIYGTVGFALMRGTRFVYSEKAREITAEIGALNDNWDFESSTGIARVLNPLVAATVGPDHYNLEAPITIRFTGPGRVVRELVQARAGNWFRGFWGGP
jgi:hypothetical protein